MAAGVGDKPDQGFLEDFGLTMDDYAHELPPEEIALFPENLLPLELFGAMSSQWRPNGSGLDYAALPATLDLLGITDKKQQRQAFDGLRVLEQEAIDRLNARRKMEASKP